MYRKLFIFPLIIIITMVIVAGCTDESNNNKKIAYICANANSEYQNTFEELKLGIIFDFNLELTRADKSWVNIWVEGYSEGKAVEPFHITELSYGLSPEQTIKGRTGFGIINPGGEEPQIFLYSLGASQRPHGIINDFMKESSISTWEYAVGNEAIGLEPGEEKILAVYRQGEDTLRSGYDYQDQDSIDEMINKDKTVLLLKIKVD